MDYTESIEKVKDYIDSHLSDELSAEKISYYAGYSVFHFCRVFKECTGKSLMRYVREKRLECADFALSMGESAADVAYEFGFETQSGFSRAYERKYGERPAKKMHA